MAEAEQQIGDKMGVWGRLQGLMGLCEDFVFTL